MIRVRVKICGVMTSEIAAVAAAAGADAIGLVFAPSRRRVTIEQASAIVAELPPFVAAVGVFVDMPADEVETTARGLPLDAVQLHGDEPPEMCSLLRRQGIRVIKALRVGDRVDEDLLGRYRQASAVMLDTKVDGPAGGSGRAFDWEAARGLSDRFPLILSGGLTPDNVGRALDIVRPYGVDVSSGVETDGRKSPEKIRQFIERVRQWEWGQ
jgi:phosphoribosylanthranilate isomerase